MLLLQHAFRFLVAKKAYRVVVEMHHVAVLIPSAGNPTLYATYLKRCNEPLGTRDMFSLPVQKQPRYLCSYPERVFVMSFHSRRKEYIQNLSSRLGLEQSTTKLSDRVAGKLLLEQVCGYSHLKKENEWDSVLP